MRHSAGAPLDAGTAWALLLALARRASAGAPVQREVSLRLEDDGSLVERPEGASVVVRPGPVPSWALPAGTTPAPDAAALFELYLPLCVGEEAGSLVVAHIAQALDGRIALASGESQFITGPENVTHTHRLRALADAVVVGRCTVRDDDPQLTTRHCAGPSPVRVVIDPARQLPADRRVFRDEASPTLLMCRRDAAAAGSRHGAAEVVGLEAAPSGELPVGAIVEELRRRGLRRIYVEGGGITVSRFLEGRALTRLHVTVAPLILGSGRPSLTLPPLASLAEARRLSWRAVSMGQDVLFDCTVLP